MTDHDRPAGSGVSRPKPFSTAEHKERRKEELRAAIANLRSEELVLAQRRGLAEAELKRLEGK